MRQPVATLIQLGKPPIQFLDRWLIFTPSLFLCIGLGVALSETYYLLHCLITPSAQHQGSLGDLLLIAQGCCRMIGITLVILGGVGLTSLILLKERLQSIDQELQTLQATVDQLEQLAAVDGLTQLANRRQFDDRLVQAWGHAQQQQQPISLVLCDIDYFKRYNDTYGHLAGDACLQGIAQALRSSTSPNDNLVARYGGEEFAVILPNTMADEAMQVATLILNNVRSLKIRHKKSDVATHVTLSLGVTTLLPNSQHPLTTLVEMADQALYEAKSQGRDRVVSKSLELTGAELLA